MASKSRGAIEEGSITFNNESEKLVNFTAGSFQNQEFPSVPIVKIISVGTNEQINTSLYQKNLLHDENGSFVPTYPSRIDIGNYDLAEASDNFKVNLDYAASLNSIVSTTSRTTLLNRFGLLTIPFDSSLVTNSSLVQFFFQAKFFTTWESDTYDDFRIYFVNKDTISESGDVSPFGSDQTQDLQYSVYINANASWSLIESNSGNLVTITGQEIEAAYGSDWSSSEKYHWFRVDVTNGIESLSELQGFNFYNTSSGTSERMYISDAAVVVWPNGTSNWDGTNVFDIDTIEQPNIGVTFSNVTKTSMTVQTTVPFTGVIRYLCSVQG